MMRYKRLILMLLVGVMLALTLPAYASVRGRRNTAIGVTAFSLYQLARGRTTTGVLSGAGAYYAWRQYNKSRKARRSRGNRDAFLQGYRAQVSTSRIERGALPAAFAAELFRRYSRAAPITLRLPGSI